MRSRRADAGDSPTTPDVRSGGPQRPAGRTSPIGRLRSRAGQTSTEYLGVVALVAAFIIVLVAFGRPLASAIAGGIADAICRVTGGDCGGGGGNGGGLPGGVVPPWAQGVGGGGGPGSVGGPHGGNPTGTQADPVNSLTGAFEAQVTDARLAGPGLPFTLARSYSSVNAGENGPLGPGWTHTYAARLEVGQGSVILHSGDGQQVPFSQQGDDLVAPPWALSELRRSDGGYELLTNSQVRYRFDGEGRLLEIADRNRNRVSLAYDDRGNLSAITDPADRRISLSSDTEDRLTEVALPDGRKVAYAYDSAGRLERVTDLSGGETTYAYDSDDRVTKVTDQRGVTLVENDYGDGGRVTRQRDARGGETSFDWDSDEQVQTMTDARGGEWRDDYEDRVLVRRTDPLGNSVELVWDEAFDLTAVTDPRGYAWRLSYDKDHNLTRVETPAPLSYSERFTYNDRNDPTDYTDPAGERWSASYDQRGNLTAIRAPDGAEASIAYDGRGLPARTSDPLGNATRRAYDRAGNLIGVTDPLGNASRFGYDEAGRLIAATDPRPGGAGGEGFTWRFSRDARDQITAASDPLGSTSRFEYDSTGRLTEVTDAKGRSATWSYDGMGEPASVTAPGGDTTAYARDRAGNVVGVRDPLGHFTEYVYDLAGRLLGVRGPSGEAAGFAYDEAGNLIATIDPNGNATDADGDGTARISYDALSRPTAVDFSDADTADISAAYDSRSLLTELRDGQGTERYEYDSMGRPTSVRRGPEAFSYRYDLAGQVVSRTYPDGSAHSYAYDAAGRLASTAGPEGTTDYGYDAAGNLTRTAYPNGIVQAIGYDPAGRVTDVLARLGSETVAESDYTLDRTGNPTLIETEQGPTAYRYDERDRLVEACYAESCDAEGAEREHFSYDPVGNITETASGGEETSYSYDASSRLTEVEGADGEVSFGHDENGNLTEAGDRGYAYDQLNQLVAVTDGEEETTYGYDGSGLRVAAEGPAGSERLSWDKSFQLPQVAVADGPGGESSYSYGINRIAQSSPAGTMFFAPDALGSTRAITTAKGAVAGRSDYRPYGEQRSEQGETPSRFRFAGELREETTGLYYLRARDYDPASGRFLQPDPIAAGVASPSRSPYSYVGGRPTVFNDPSGLCFLGAVGCAVSDGAQAFDDNVLDPAGNGIAGGAQWFDDEVLDPTGNWIGGAAEDVYTFAGEHADEAGLVLAAGAFGVCTVSTGGACAALGISAAGAGIFSSGYDSGVIGPGDADYGEFALGSALSYGPGKGFGYLRNLDEAARIGSRTSRLSGGRTPTLRIPGAGPLTERGGVIGSYARGLTQRGGFPLGYHRAKVGAAGLAFSVGRYGIGQGGSPGQNPSK